MIASGTQDSSRAAPENASANALVEVRELRKRFGVLEALRGISFAVEPGEIFGLLGPNGAGKSTTVNILSGLCRPDSGTVRVAGFAPGNINAKRLLGVVPQELALYPELSAWENLSFFGQLYGMRGAQLRASVERALALVDLSARSRDSVEKYSGGMARRLNIAAAILHSPQVVLMDEPTVGLDPQNRQAILEMVREIAAGGASIVYSTHYMDEAEQLCDRIAIVDHGAVLVQGTLKELQKASGSREMVTIRGRFSATSAAFDRLRDVLPDASIAKAEAAELVVSVDGGIESKLQTILEFACRMGTVSEVHVNKQTLESLFIKLTGRDLRDVA